MLAHAHDSVLSGSSLFYIIASVHSLHVIVHSHVTAAGRTTGNDVRTALHQRVVTAAFILAHCPMAAAQRLGPLLRKQRIGSNEHFRQHSVVIFIFDIALGNRLT